VLSIVVLNPRERAGPPEAAVALLTKATPPLPPIPAIYPRLTILTVSPVVPPDNDSAGVPVLVE
jgi:hypothetical protein